MSNITIRFRDKETINRVFKDRRDFWDPIDLNHKISYQGQVAIIENKYGSQEIIPLDLIETIIVDGKLEL